MQLWRLASPNLKCGLAGGDPGELMGQFQFEGSLLEIFFLLVGGLGFLFYSDLQLIG